MLLIALSMIHFHIQLMNTKIKFPKQNLLFWYLSVIITMPSSTNDFVYLKSFFHWVKGLCLRKRKQNEKKKNCVWSESEKLFNGQFTLNSQGRLLRLATNHITLFSMFLLFSILLPLLIKFFFCVQRNWMAQQVMHSLLLKREFFFVFCLFTQTSYGTDTLHDTIIDFCFDLDQ